MIAQLRKRHVYIWCLLAIFLPVAIIAAYAVIPAQVTDRLFLRELPDALPEQLAAYETEDIVLRLRGDKQLPNKQLEIILAKPLVSASTLVYVTNEAPKGELTSQNLIGILGPKRVYRLTVPATISSKPHIHITLYDALKAKTIHSIHLQL